MAVVDAILIPESDVLIQPGPFDAPSFCISGVRNAGYDIVPPYILSASPAADSTDVPIDSAITFTVIDDSPGVMLAGMLIRLDVGAGWVNVYDPTGFLNGYTGSVTPNGLGYDFSITPPTDLPWLTTVSVGVLAYDSSPFPNELDTTYSFESIFEPIAPTISAMVPAPDATSVPKDSMIAFTLDDDSQGVLLSSVSVSVDVGNGGGFVSAYSSSAFANGYTGSVSANGIGYDFSITPPADFADEATIRVMVEASDIGGNPGTLVYTYTFQVAQDAAIVRLMAARSTGSRKRTVFTDKDGRTVVFKDKDESFKYAVDFGRVLGTDTIVSATATEVMSNPVIVGAFVQCVVAATTGNSLVTVQTSGGSTLTKRVSFRDPRGGFLDWDRSLNGS